MKKTVKKVLGILLILTLMLQMIPAYTLMSEAVDSSTSTQDYVNEETGVKFVYYEDISEYREDTYTCPEEEGYVFGGWWTNVTAATDAQAVAVSKEKTDGAAWAKFVPEEVLSVKVQVSKRVAEAKEDDKVKMRFVTTVDSLRYEKVGFLVSFKNQEHDVEIDTVYSKIQVTDSNDRGYEAEPTVFSPASYRFATVKVKNIPYELFTTCEFNVTPYWVTKDGTTVQGVNRNRILVSDDLANETDGSGFTQSDNTYTYQTETSSENTVSCQYLKGASDTVYLEETYTSAGNNNRFGISIRNGGETRQVFFDGYGVKVVKAESMDKAGYANNSYAADKYSAVTTDDNGVYVWVQAYNENGIKGSIVSAVSAMLSATAGTETKVIWAIEDNVLYCAVDGKVTLRLPMELLCEDWKDGRYYQLGVAGYNSQQTESAMVCDVHEYKLGNEAYGTEDTPLLQKETENLNKTKMVYVPINGSYLGGSTTAQGTANEMSAVTETVSADTPVGVETTVENWGDGNSQTDGETAAGVTVVVTKSGTKYNRQLMFFNDAYVRIQEQYKWTEAYKADVHGKLNRNLPNSNEVQAKISAFVYDDTFYVLVDDITAYQCTITELFGTDDVSGYEDIQIGISSYEHSKGNTPVFTNVQTYAGDDAIEAKTEHWTFWYTYSTNGTVSMTNGTIGLNSYGGMSFIGLGDAVELSGTISHTAFKELYSYAGFTTLGGSSGKFTRLMATKNNFRYDTGTDKGSAYGYQANHKSAATYTIATPANSTLCTNSATEEVPFKVVAAYDTCFVWFDNQLSCMIPLSVINANMVSGEQVRLALYSWDNGGSGTINYKNLSYKKDSEIDAELLNTLKWATDMDWKSAKSMRTLTADGKVKVLNTTGTKDSNLTSNKFSDAIYISETWEKTSDNTKGKMTYAGISVRDESGKAWRVYLADNCAYVQPGVSGWQNWYKNDSSSKYVKNATVLQKLANAKVGEKHNVVWLYRKDTFSVTVDGVLAMEFPIVDFYEEWTSGTKLSIGIAAWEPKENGWEQRSNIQAYYGTEAETAFENSNIGVSTQTLGTRSAAWDVTGTMMAATDGVQGFEVSNGKKKL